MATYRLSGAARADIIEILRASRAQFGSAAQKRYRSLLLASFKTIASNPLGPLVRDRSDLSRGVHSFHIRHTRGKTDDQRVTMPSHLIFYRLEGTETIVILRILHERMDPEAHVP